MTSYKTLCVVSLGSFLAIAAGFVIASEVRAGDVDEVPDGDAVDSDTLARASAFAGEYTFVGGQKERDGLDAAIEASVNAVSPVVRGIGRKRLQESNPIPKQLTITVNGDAVDIRFDGEGHSAGLDGKPVKGVSPQGDKVKVSHRMKGTKLTERIDGDQGDRHNTFKLGSDGKLTVDVEITSGHLPVPVEYRLTFKKR
ncbi:MAG TPA: hypothetical protein VM869_28520 [Enhygromyxa sp.]|nr:hypothetical protein [Enhygromyxa sp.]